MPIELLRSHKVIKITVPLNGVKHAVKLSPSGNNVDVASQYR